MAILKISIPKGGKDCSLDIDTLEFLEGLSEDAYLDIITKGLGVIANARMSKLSAPSKMSGEELEANAKLALERAHENLANLKAGKVTKSRSSKAASTAPREVMTEARRLAKEKVKDLIRAAGMKPSLVAAADITAEANKLIASDPDYLRQAEANIAERSKMPSPKLDIASIIKESPKLLEKAAKAAAERKAVLSAKQADKPAKPKGRVPAKRGDKPSNVHALQ